LFNTPAWKVIQIRMYHRFFPKPVRLDALTPFPAGDLLADMFDRMKGPHPETAAHCRRVAVEAGRIAGEMALAGEMKTVVVLAALFHDIGKTSISNDILRKEGLLTGEEFEAVKMHTEKTREILRRIDWPPTLQSVPEVAGSHHERWDGSGYPRGAAGEDIPLGARVIAVADAFDALTSKRRYRTPMTSLAAGGFLAGKRGSHFDPAVIDAFLRRFSPAPCRQGITRISTCAERPRFSEGRRRCPGSESRRCR